MLNETYLLQRLSLDCPLSFVKLGQVYTNTWLYQQSPSTISVQKAPLLQTDPKILLKNKKLTLDLEETASCTCTLILI